MLSSRVASASTDFTAVDRTRRLLFVSFIKSDTGATYNVDTTYIRATIDSSGNLVFTRNTSDGFAIDINWTLVELPEEYVSVRHGTHTQSTGTSNNTFDIATPVYSTNNAFVIGTVCTPFGCGTGSTDDTGAGTVGRTQATLAFDDTNTIRVQRADGTGNFEIGYQVVEFLAKKATVTSTLSLSDTVSTQATYTRTLSETLTSSDAITTSADRSVTLSETAETGMLSRSGSCQLTGIAGVRSIGDTRIPGAACGWLKILTEGVSMFTWKHTPLVLLIREQARFILDMTPPGEEIGITYADPSMWSSREYAGTRTTTAGEYAAEGVILTRADNDRLTGKRKVDRLLMDLADGQPGIQIFESCKNLIRTLPALPYDETRKEDIDTEAEDHAYDALRYGLSNAAPSGKQPDDKNKRRTRFGMFGARL